jgi:hypothetical protein
MLDTLFDAELLYCLVLFQYENQELPNFLNNIAVTFLTIIIRYRY